MIPHFYAQGAVIGSYDSYKTNRNIFFVGQEDSFDPFVRTAKSKPHGFSFLSHFETGYLIGDAIQFRPYAKGDYTIVHRNNFTENGANSIDLSVQSHNADLLRLEIGAELLGCFKYPSIWWKPHALIGGVFENRFIGTNQTANFTSVDCKMTTQGLQPDQSLFLFEGGLMTSDPLPCINISGIFRGEWGKQTQNIGWSIQARCIF